MIKSIKLFGFLSMATGLVLLSCKSDSSEGEKEDNASAKSAYYEYNEGTTVFEWTAYKFADKSGPVPGGFNEIEVESEGSENAKDVIESIRFKIATASVETQNEDRNKKIAEFFFGTINTQEITGKFLELKDNGKARVSIRMNGIDFEIEGDYELDDNDFSFNASMDVSNWNGMPGINKLNEICEDLHKKTPKDESKLWSEVNLKLTTSLKKVI